jgi:protease PrsW
MRANMAGLSYHYNVWSKVVFSQFSQNRRRRNLFVFLILLFLVNVLITDWDLPGSPNNWKGHLFGLLCLAVAPGFTIGLYVYYCDNLYDESWRLLGILFIWSFLATTLALFPNEIGYALIVPSRGVTETFLFYFGVVAVGEELIKLIVVWLLGYRGFKQVYDGVLFTAISALGFATNENLFYVMTSGEDAAFVGILRAYSAVPLHLCTGVVMGYFMGRAREVRGKREEKERILIGFGAAVAIHGAYDFVLSVDGLVLLHIPLLIVGWWYGLRRIKKAMAFTPFSRCKKCSTRILRLANFCSTCRNPQSVELSCNHCGAGVDKWNQRCGGCGARIRFPWHLQAARMHELYTGPDVIECGDCKERIPERAVFCLHCGCRR